MPDCWRPRRPLDDWGRELDEWVEEELTEFEREWEDGIPKSRGILFDIWRAMVMLKNVCWTQRWAGHDE
jgi:hypothetical protein